MTGTVLLRHAYGVDDAEVRNRTLVLRCVPIGVPALVADSDSGEPYRERFAPGAFNHIDPRRVDLRVRHSTDSYERYGVGTRLHEDAGYLVGHFPVYEGDRGDHLLADVDELRGVSIGFEPGFDRQIMDAYGPVVERVKVKRLPEVSLLRPEESAYPGAELLLVRQRHADMADLLAWRNEIRRVLL